MAKFISYLAGELTEVNGTSVSAGVTDANEIVQLGADGRLDVSLLPTGVGADTAIVQASEAIGAGDPVNVFDSSGDFRVRRADAATAGREANGFVLAAVASGANATIYFEGRVTGLAGQTPGKKWLAAGGGYTSTAPVNPASAFAQSLGVAVSATEINFERGNIVILVA